MAFRDSSEIITRARYRLSDASAVIFGSAEMTSHLEAVVNDYSAYNPYMTSTTITTVADQSLYTLPAACLWLSRVYIDDADNDSSETIEDILVDIRDYLDSYDLHQLRAQLRERYSNYGQPVATMWNAQLYLHPAPTDAGDSIVVQYGGIHAATTGNYTTIPLDHIPLIEDMLVLRCLDAMALDASLRPDYSDGQSRITNTTMADKLQRMADRVRVKVENKLSMPVGLVQ